MNVDVLKLQVELTENHQKKKIEIRASLKS